MITGQFIRSIDSKNRVVLPPSIKAAFGNVFYLTLSTEKKLEIRTSSEFENFVDRIDQNNQLDPTLQKYKRFIMSNSHRIETDKIGRFLIPDNFHKAIAIKNSVTFIGMGKIVEIWATENIQSQLDELKEEGAIEDLASEMLKKGFKL